MANSIAKNFGTFYNGFAGQAKRIQLKILIHSVSDLQFKPRPIAVRKVGKALRAPAKATESLAFEQTEN